MTVFACDRPALAGNQLDAPGGQALGVEANDTDAAAVENANDIVGVNVPLVRDDEDAAATHYFWSSPASRSAFFV